MNPNDMRDPGINVTKFFIQWNDGHIMLFYFVLFLNLLLVYTKFTMKKKYILVS